jgi:hypothetical protein
MVTPGSGGSDGWVALRGQKPRESVHDGARHPGQTLKRGVSLWKVASALDAGRAASRANTARWLDHEAGALNPYGAST